MRIVVTGAAGLIGSHLCEVLLRRGDEVVAVDNFVSGRRDNLASLLEGGGANFSLIEADVSWGVPVEGPLDAVAHLASPASPADFARIPLEILRVGSLGTFHALDLAERADARFVLASTSEIYGDPLVHPQPESYRGNASTVGPRSCYDEAKRFAEAATASYRRKLGLSTGIVRIFNTYGPRMRPDDGRVVSNFVVQALCGQPLTVYGDGEQIRSYCYVDDLVDGLVALIDSDFAGPVNLGNPSQFTVSELAEMVIEMTGSTAGLERRPLPEDDPIQRCPDITLARDSLGWVPRIPLRQGLERTIDHFRKELGLATTT